MTIVPHKYILKLNIVEIGDKISRAELIEQGWKMVKEIQKASCEIWTKNTWLGSYRQSIIWRVKTKTVYLMWDSIIPKRLRV